MLENEAVQPLEAIQHLDVEVGDEAVSAVGLPLATRSREVYGAAVKQLETLFRLMTAAATTSISPPC